MGFHDRSTFRRVLMLGSGVYGAAGALLRYEAEGLAADFTDMTAVVKGGSSPFRGNPNNLLTYTSPSTKWILGSGGLYVSGTTLRTEYNASGVALGLRVEEARTNVALWDRDLTNAVWTKTNVTAAKDQVGIDDVANSASSITATAGNGTCLQAITLASSVRWQSAFVKRITGSGTINMTMDNGTTWTVVTVTSSWTRVEVPTQTLANPTVGFRVVTSGDAIAVDFVQNENGAFATSPIATTTATVTRAVDNLSIATSLFPYNQPAGTVYVEFNIPTAITSGRFINLSSGGAANRVVDLYWAAGPAVEMYNGTAVLTPQPYVTGANAKAGGVYQTLSYALSANGSAVATAASAAVNTATLLQIGQFGAGAVPVTGYIRSVMYLPRRMSNAELQAVTA